MSKVQALRWIVAWALACVAALASAATAPSLQATVTRTRYGIPHVTAPDWAGLGFGTAVAFAEDNVCLLADHLVTISGQRSRYFGANATVTVAFQDIPNVDSDAYFQGTFDDAALAAAARTASADYQALLRGYVAGYNHYLTKTGRDHLPKACRNAPWVRPMTVADALRLNEDKMRLASSERFAVSIVSAKPPGGAVAATSHRIESTDVWEQITGHPQVDFGSNGWAFGGDVTGGPGVLLGNPHFPWLTTNRFWQVHQTIPGKLDVMGVTLSGLPSVVIGFNHDIAWTHTVSTDRHFTFFELTLDPADPTVYLVDGKPFKMQRRAILVQTAEGAPIERTVYESIYGPIVVMPPLGLTWTHEHAYALKDADALNFRAPDAWLRIEQADSVKAIQRAITEPVGIPWVNTIAVDRRGDVLYADVTPTPNVTETTLQTCAAKANAALAPMRLTVLDGSRSACDWSADPKASTTGLLAASAMPQLLRRDFVANSNDSYWLANDTAPLRGSPAIVGAVDEPQGLRTRHGLMQIHAAIAAHPVSAGSAITPAVVEDLILRNDNLAATLALDDVLSLCGESAEAVTSKGEAVSVADGCAVLAQWDRKMNLDSRGAALWNEFWAPLSRSPGGYPAAAVPFDAADPVHTPRGLRRDGEHGTHLRTTLADAMALLKARGVALDAPWGTVQNAVRGERHIPIHGGSGMQGVLNMQEAPWVNGVGYQPVHGSSYVQVVTFDAQGPVADAVLSYSQSTDADSAHYADQTELYSRKAWNHLPFSPAEIRAQQLSVEHLRQH